MALLRWPVTNLLSLPKELEGGPRKGQSPKEGVLRHPAKEPHPGHAFLLGSGEIGR